MYTVSNALLDRLLSYFAQTEHFAFFDTAKPCQENRASYLFAQPMARLQCGTSEDPGAFLRRIQKWLDRGYYVAGWFGYEFGRQLLGVGNGIDCGPRRGWKTLADLGVYAAPKRFDHRSGNHDFLLETTGAAGDFRIAEIEPNIRQDEYLRALESVLEYIRAGDTYQVNYTLKLLFELSGSHEALFRALRRNQSVAYGAYIRWGDERVMSFSPELFFRRHTDGLTVRPMKGTLKRGRNPAEDAEARDFLHNDTKNRSENVMIVDLLRNDLGRVMHESGGGEVRVRSLFDVETYESLLQMTSTIDGLTRHPKMAEIALHTLFTALFPCGSVTGAPKIRTMEIIEELEKEPRGVYTGAVGFFAPDGEAVFNVPIRTLVFDGNKGEMGIGSGITHDSDPLEEWKECLLKGRFLTDPDPEFRLIETLLWSPEGGFWLLDEHLERLTASAGYFQFVCRREAVMEQLSSHVAGRGDSLRVRLTLAKDGVVEVASQPCALPRAVRLPQRPEPAGPEMPMAAWAGQAIDSASAWRMHKTTRRELYDREFAMAGAAGCLDCLFVNERGELTEGAITNVVVFLDGRYLTPPLTCGLLAGTMRQRLLADPEVRLEERILTPADLLAAEAVFLVNSVRGVVQVRVAPRS